ncbi:hypothetical protein J6590_092606 [Homalodisca vitripennis]|nr:hypothetical protein J6590_092606 [Homalodisca vitripennis]
MLISKKSCDDVRDSHADMKNWYSPIMMEKFGIGVVRRAGGGNIKIRNNEGDAGSLRGSIRKATFGSARAFRLWNTLLNDIRCIEDRARFGSGVRGLLLGDLW